MELMKNKKTLFILFALILVVIGLFVYRRYVSVRLPFLSISSKSLIYPKSNLVRIDSWEDGTYVKYETTHINIVEYYEKLLKNEGWNKKQDIDIQTSCMGDWGGVYEKDGNKFKIHVCGPDNMVVASKSITLYFYGDARPENFLGEDLSGGSFSCYEDAVLIPIDSCYSQDILFVTFSVGSSRANKFELGLMEKERHYYDVENVKARPDKNGVVKIEYKVSIDKFSDRPKFVQIQPYTPNYTSCSEQTIKFDLERCK
jgi:hypothetical protein